jgi:hypothetical protein
LGTLVGECFDHVEKRNLSRDTCQYSEDMAA